MHVEKIVWILFYNLQEKLLKDTPLALNSLYSLHIGLEPCKDLG